MRPLRRRRDTAERAARLLEAFSTQRLSAANCTAPLPHRVGYRVPQAVLGAVEDAAADGEHGREVYTASKGRWTTAVVDRLLFRGATTSLWIPSA